MLLVGLTGGIASGKTTVSDAFEALGAGIIDADLLSREVVAAGSTGLQRLREHFGESILTSEAGLDRVALRNIIFNDSSQRECVNQIVHPLIRTLADERISEARAQQHAYTLYAIPLLIETQQQSRFDRILVVDVQTSTQIARLMARDQCTEKEAKAILQAQASREQRLAVADDVILNDGSKQDVLDKVQQLHQLYLTLGSQ